MARRLFTISEVEQLIPRLEGIFTQVIQLRSGLRGLEQKLERAGVRMTQKDVLESDTGSLDVRRFKAVFRGLYETLVTKLEEVRALGGEVKDLEIGLVDFAARRGGDDILLCWCLGEKKIAYWHALDAGYRNRRPVDSQIARDPSRPD